MGKTTLRQAYRDVNLGESPVHCVPGMLPRTVTLLWVGMDGGSLISPPLSNLVHFIMRTVVICFCFHLS